MSGLDDQIAKLTQALGQDTETMPKRMTEPEGPIRIDNKGNLIGPYDIGRYESVGNVASPMSAPESVSFNGDNSGYSGVGSSSPYDSVENVASPMNAPEPVSYTGDNSGYANVGGFSPYDSVGNYATPMNSTEGGYATLGDAFAASVMNHAGAASAPETKSGVNSDRAPSRGRMNRKRATN